MDHIAPVITPRPPYYCVVFTSRRTSTHEGEYQKASDRMMDVAQTIPGFLGVETARDARGIGITVSYWESEEAITEWRQHAEHVIVQRQGRDAFYEWYELRVGRVERASSFRKR
jgi:heme-degrading monooxygenase HmoA